MKTNTETFEGSGASIRHLPTVSQHDELPPPGVVAGGQYKRSKPFNYQRLRKLPNWRVVMRRRR
jgi:hypothetical protein